MSLIGSVGELVATITADISQFLAGLDNAVSRGKAAGDSIGKSINEGLDQIGNGGNPFAGLSDSIDKAQEKLLGWSDGLLKTGLAVSGVSAPMALLGKEAIETAGKFEQTQIAFTHFMKSSDLAKKFLADLYQFAATTPLQVGQVTSAAQRLMAMGTATKEVIPELRIIGDQLSAVGKTENLGRVIYALGEMSKATKGFGVQLRELLVDGVIPAKEYLAEAFNVPASQIDAMLKKGLIPGAQAVKIILAGMARDTGGLMNAQMGSFVGQASNMKDQITLTLKAIGDQLLPSAKQFISWASTILSYAREIAEWFGKLPAPVKTFILALGSLTAIAGPLLVSLGLLTLALGSLSAPILGVTVAVVATTAAIAALYVWFQNLTPLQRFTVEAGLLAAGLLFLPNVIAGVTAVFTAMSAVLPIVTAGLSSFATKGLLAATVNAQNMNGVVTNSTMLIGRLANVAIIAASAFAAWQLGTWLRENIPLVRAFGDALGEWIAKIPGVVTLMNYLGGVSKQVSDAQKGMAFTTEELAKRLAAHGVVIERGSLSLEQYASKLREAAAAISVSTSEHAKTAPILAAVADGHTKAHKAIKDHHEAITIATQKHADFNVGAQQTADFLASLKNRTVEYSTAIVQANANEVDLLANMQKMNRTGAFEAGASIVGKPGSAGASQGMKTGGSNKGKDPLGLASGINEVGNSFQRNLAGMLDGTKRFKTAWGSMVQDIAGMFAAGLAKMATQWVTHLAQKLLLHVVTNNAMTASDLGASLKQEAIEIAQHIKSIARLAAKAAAKAFTSAMELPPPVNFIVAPVAAAAAFAGVLSLGVISAESGADLPNRETIGMLHPREMVLPQKYADVIRGMGETGSATGASFSGDMHYHAAAGEKFTHQQWLKIGREAMRNNPGMRLAGA